MGLRDALLRDLARLWDRGWKYHDQHASVVVQHLIPGGLVLSTGYGVEDDGKRLGCDGFDRVGEGREGLVPIDGVCRTEGGDEVVVPG